jgi:hypothetical protein
VIGADACLADGQPQVPGCIDNNGDEDIPATAFATGTHAFYVDSFYAAGAPCGGRATTSAARPLHAERHGRPAGGADRHTDPVAGDDSVCVVIGLWAGLLASSVFGGQEPATPPPSPSPAAAPVLEIAEPAASFGEAYQGALLTHRFVVRNAEARPVRITASPVSPRARVAPHPDVCPPEARATSRWSSPPRAVSAWPASASPCARTTALSASSPSRASSNRPTTRPAHAGPRRRGPGWVRGLELFSREVDRLEVLGVEGGPAFLSVDTQGRAGPAGRASP